MQRRTQSGASHESMCEPTLRVKEDKHRTSSVYVRPCHLRTVCRHRHGGLELGYLRSRNVKKRFWKSFCCLVIHLSITWTQYISTTCPTHLFTPYTCCHSPDHTHLHLVTCLHALYINIYIPQLHTLLALLLASPCIFVPLFSDNLGFCVFLVTFVFSAWLFSGNDLSVFGPFPSQLD